MAILSNFPEKRGLNTDDINDIVSGEISNGFVQSQTCYSTEEQIVGKWIDGKPLYQKTFTGTTSTTTSSDSVAGTITNLDTLVNSNGTIFLAGTWGVINIHYHIIMLQNIILIHQIK